MINLNIEKTFGFISKEKVSAYEKEPFKASAGGKEVT